MCRTFLSMSGNILGMPLGQVGAICKKGRGRAIQVNTAVIGPVGSFSELWPQAAPRLSLNACRKNDTVNPVRPALAAYPFRSGGCGA